MRTTNLYVHTDRRLRGLRPILTKWTELNRRLGRRWMKHHGDAPWWYNERALLSVFVGAVWQSGEEAFEEFSQRKRGSRKKLRTGRIDLWFTCGRREYFAEAKHREIGIANNGKQIDQIKEMMRWARRDAGLIPPDGFTRRLAVVFCMPFMRPGPRKEIDERIAWWLEKARTVDHGALAWVFPRMKKLPKAYGWISPGIIVWIKEVRRRVR